MRQNKYDILAPDGVVKLHSGVFNANCVRKFSLMSEDSITLSFFLRDAVNFPVGSSVGDFFITKEQVGTWNANTGVWDYQLKFDAYYWLWANKILRYIIPGVDSAKETSFSLTATIDVHAAVIKNCLDFLGLKFGGSPFRIDTTDTSLSSEAKLVRYENLSVLGGIQAIAETFECEWWVDGNAVYFGRCENKNSDFTFEAGVNVSSISLSQSKTEVPNRLYVYGSDRNLPVNYRETSGNDTIGGVVNKRLMLPEGTPYLQTEPNMPESQIVEAVVVLDSVYPKTSLTITEEPEVYVSESKQESGDVVSQTFYRIKYGTGFPFFSSYVLPNEELHVIFQSGLLNGMEFGVRFNPKGLNEKNQDGTMNPEAQMFEIIANGDYGRQLPDDILRPYKDDKFILTGWDSTKMADLGLIANAEAELLAEGQKALVEYAKDTSTCTCPMAWDYMKPLIEQNRQPKAGDSVTIIDTAHFGKVGRKSRVIGYEYKLDKPYAECTYTCGENVSVSRLKSIENKIDGLTKSGTKVQMQNSLDFLSKRYADRTPYLLSSDTGFEVGKFLAGVSGGQFAIDKKTGHSYAELDKIYIRVRAYFESLTVIERESLAGEQQITPGGGVVCTSVEEVKDADDNLIGWRCYFLSEQDGEKRETKIIAGDQAIAQIFNATTGTTNKVSNKRWWRLVTDVSNDAKTDDSGNHYGYIEVSKGDCEIGSDIPRAGDEIVQFGSREDATRQAAIIISTVSADAPSMKLFTGIGSGMTNEEHYSLVDRDIISYGYDHALGRAYMRCYGDLWLGDKGGTSYVKYDSEAKKWLFHNVSISVTSTIGDKTIDQYIKDVVPPVTQEDIEGYVNAIVDPKIEGIQNQIDGVIETWFANGVPTLANYPVNEWTTNADKEKHLSDLYFDNDTGFAYRFSKDENGNYFWNGKVDSATAKALADAKKAQDTADGKRRVFTSQPVPPYEVGDIWVNATYDTQYSNDILRCVTAKAKGGTFSISDWTLASKYTDDRLAQEAKNEIAGYKYLKKAFQGASITQGGLFLSSYIKLGEWDLSDPENPVMSKVWAGHNGIYDNPKTISSFWGGDMVDRFYDENGNLRTTPLTSGYSAALVRMDGGAYFSKGNIGFEADGSGWLGHYSNGIRFDSAGTMTFGNGIKIDLNGGSEGLKDTLESILNFQAAIGNLLKPCDANNEEIRWVDATLSDGAGGIKAKSLKTVVNFFSEKSISAKGTAKGGGSGRSTLEELNDVRLSDVTAGQALVYNGTYWVNQLIKSGLDESALATYLTENNYAKKSDIPSLAGYATESWVTGKGYITPSALAPYLKIDGSNGTAAGVSTLINKLTEGASDPTDNDYYIAQYAGGGTSTITYHRRKTSSLWNYIQGKGNSVWQPKGNYLTGHQPIYALTIQKNGSTAGTYTPNSKAATINISDVASASTLSSHIGNTTVHITADERTKWNKTTTDFNALMGTDSDTVINKWQEVVNFLANYTEADTLANLLSNKVDKVSGYGLSKNDFTDALLTKLNGIEAGANKYVLPTASATTKGGIKVGSGLTIASEVLGVNLSASHIPTLAISKISDLQAALDSKLNAATFNDLFEKVQLSDGTWSIKAKYGLWTEYFISSKGTGSGGSSGSGAAYNRLDNWGDYTTDKSSWVLSAKLGYDLKTRIDNLPTTSVNPYALTIQRNGSTLGVYDGSVAKTINISDVASASALSSLTSRVGSLEGNATLSLTTTGSGNAITSISKSGTVITANKGATFLTSHQNLNHIKYVDRRDSNLAPYARGQKFGVEYQLKENTADGLSDGGTYHGVLNLHQWEDPSGGAAHQLAFTDNGSVWMRYGFSSWSAWHRFVYTDEIPTKVSQLTNDAGYITSLANYYTKSETDSGFLKIRGIRSDLDSIYSLRFNIGVYDKGDYHGTYASEYPTNFGTYLSIAYNDKNSAALMFFDSSQVETGHVYVRTRTAGDRNTTYFDWRTLAYTSDLTWGNLLNKPTTISGYGITDAVTLNTAQTISGVKTFSSALTATKFIKSGGTSSQFLKADGSVDGTAYVNKAGDKMTGSLRFPGSGSLFYADDTYGSYMQYSTHYINVKSDGLWHNNKYRIWDSGNDGSGSGLDADLLDGFHFGSFEGRFKTVIDATKLDNNTWYPVTMSIGNSEQTRIRIEGRTSAPASWNSRTDKTMAIVLDYTVNGSLWGWTPVTRVVHQWLAGAGAVSNAVCGLGQMTNTSNEYVFVRGGAVYSFYLSRAITPVLRTSAYTVQSQTVQPTTTQPALIQRTNALITDNVASATKLQTARTIWGQSFDGTGNVSGDITGVHGIVMSGFLRSTVSGTPQTVLDYHSDGSLALNYGLAQAGLPCHIYGATILGNNVVSGNPRYALDVRGSIIADGFIRTTGETGWYNETHGGGWYMSDSGWIRSYSSKSLYMGNGEIQTLNNFNRRGAYNYSWNQGRGAYNVALPNNNSQTPLLLAYNQAVDVGSATGANRFFAMEILNDGTLLRYYFLGSYKYSMTSGGVFHAVGGVTTDGYVTAKLSSSSSDIRLKNIVGDTALSIRDIANAPSKYFTWKKDGDNRRNAGTIAQYWLDVLPEVVSTDDRGFYSVAYGNLGVAIGIANSRELLKHESDIDKLKRRVEELELKNRELEMKLH